MRCMLLVALCSALGATVAAREDEQPSLDTLSARQAVRLGNQQLTSGDASSALEAYSHAEKLRPDAPEISFVEGLGHYALHEYEEARAAFERASLSKNRTLADDALYGIGTTYHAEALAGRDDPKLAVEKLENAINRYREVLADLPDHEAARDAIVKAAAMRRRIKRMMEQQEQNKDRSQPDNEQDGEEQEQKQEGSDQQEDRQQEQGEQQDSDEESPDKQQQQEESARQDEQSDDESSRASESDAEEEEEQPRPSEAAQRQEESVSREQAQRRLREMMQALRERDKRRRETAEPLTVEPVDKDW